MEINRGISKYAPEQFKLSPKLAHRPNMPTTRPLNSSPLIHNFLVIGERFRNHVDLDHVVQHVSDSHKKHRALLLKRPTTELSGLYTCKVSTFVSEDVRRKKMTVYCKLFFQVPCSSDQTTIFNFLRIFKKNQNEKKN